MTNKEFLQDTLNYFSGKGRCVDNDGKCVYSPANGLEGCAIGRHLLGKEKDKHLWDVHMGAYSSYRIDDELGKLRDIRPEWMKTMDETFLVNVQALHDGIFLWEGRYLKKSGIDRVKEICEKFQIPFDEITIPQLEIPEDPEASQHSDKMNHF